MEIGPIQNQNLILWPLADVKDGARTMEIGPIQDQNLISWPFANNLPKIGEGQ